MIETDSAATDRWLAQWPRLNQNSILNALCPGLNDTTAAIKCMDYFTAILAGIAPLQSPSSHRNEKGELRVISNGSSFESLLAESFAQIHRNAKGSVAIMSQSVSRRRMPGEQVHMQPEVSHFSESTYEDALRWLR
ncbi:MAG: DUF2254 family protein [Planctomycetota bacterium]|nr:DUF2254 family protein [Planctomycetota bacterium]